MTERQMPYWLAEELEARAYTHPVGTLYYPYPSDHTGCFVLIEAGVDRDSPDLWEWRSSVTPPVIPQED